MLTEEENRKMPVVASYMGTMLAADDRNGIPHKNWRKIFVTARGVIEIRQSDICPDEYVIYFYMRNGRSMHTSSGTFQIDGKKLRMETKSSIYEFELDSQKGQYGRYEAIEN